MISWRLMREEVDFNSGSYRTYYDLEFISV